MSNEKQVKLFTQDLRRVLYMAQIFRYNLEWLKMGDLCPSFMKVDINNITNSINRLFADMMCKASRQTWEQVRCDLSREQLHDISLLLETVSNVKNVAEITEIINGCKIEAA